MNSDLPKQASQLLSQMQGGRPRLLLVDDDQAILEALHDILDQGGYLVDTATSSKEAVELINRRLFNLAIVDYSLPDGDGIDLCEHLRQVNPLLHCILLSGHANLANQLRDRPQPFSILLTKPVDVEDLKRTIAMGLEDHRDAASAALTLASMEELPTQALAPQVVLKEDPLPAMTVSEERNTWRPLLWVIGAGMAGYLLGHQQPSGFSFPRFKVTNQSLSANDTPQTSVPRLDLIVPPQEPEPVSVSPKLQELTRLFERGRYQEIIARYEQTTDQDAPLFQTAEAKKIVYDSYAKLNADKNVPALSTEIDPATGMTIQGVVAETIPQALPPTPVLQTHHESSHPQRTLSGSHDPIAQLAVVKRSLRQNPDDAPARRTLHQLLQHHDADMRQAAVETIEDLKLHDPEAIQALIGCLHDEDGEVSRAAAHALGSLKEKALPAVDDLMRAVLSSNPTAETNVSVTAENALVQIGSPAVPRLIQALHDRRSRVPAIGILRAMGPAAQAAVPDLKALESDAEIADWVREALRRIAPPEEH